MDPASGIGIPVAFGAGLISFLSPCVLPLVPGYISAVAGVAPSEIRPRRVLGPSLAFVASFSVIFIGLGLLGQQALHGALTGPAAQKVSGALIVVMGLLFVLAPFVPRLAREWHVGKLMQRAGRGGPVLTGAAFALAWTPCTGPTLGAIVTAAGTSNSAAHGAFLLAVYCAGLGVPFIVTGLAFGTVTSALAVVKRHYPLVIGTGGAGADRDGGPDLDGRVHTAQRDREQLVAEPRAARPQLVHLILGRSSGDMSDLRGRTSLIR